MWPEDRVRAFHARRDDPAFLRVEAWERSVLRSFLADLDLAGATVLDAPCGDGRLFDLFAERTCRVIGVDADRGSCERARERASGLGLSALVLERDLEELELPSAGAAVCVRLWAHLDLATADALLVRLFIAAPLVLLQINERNGSEEASAIARAGGHRLDEAARIERLARTAAGAGLLFAERLAGSTACLLAFGPLGGGS